jgi:hypothetical protein
MKQCKRCGTEKHPSEFYVNRAKKDGLTIYCKVCCEAIRKRWAQSERGAEICRKRVREYRKTDAGKASHRADSARQRADNRKKIEARKAVFHAINDGTLVKWPVCAIPECECTKVEAHHADYDAPLDVVWLCRDHHRMCHKELAA